MRTSPNMPIQRRLSQEDLHPRDKCSRLSSLEHSNHPRAKSFIATSPECVRGERKFYIGHKTLLVERGKLPLKLICPTCTSTCQAGSACPLPFFLSNSLAMGHYCAYVAHWKGKGVSIRRAVTVKGETAGTSTNASKRVWYCYDT